MRGHQNRFMVFLAFALFVVGAFAMACADESEQLRDASRAAEKDARESTERAGVESHTRNLILVCLDTLRADHVGHYGYERATTPNLDAFASSAVVFERAYAQASSTRPSHQSMFQSRPSSDAANNHLALAEVLAARGFRTRAFTGGGNISSRLGFARGFEQYDELTSGLAGSLPAAASWVREHRNEPFFLFLHTYDIHLPYDPPEPHASMYTESYSGQVRGDNTRELLRRVRGLDGHGSVEFDLAEVDRQRVIDLYDGGIHYTDGQLSHLFRLAEELDLYRDTVFVFFSDHGEEFWEHGTTIHSHSLYQELLRVPLIVRAPGLERARVGEVVPLMDLAPTILELLAIPAPKEFEGTSLVGLMSGDDTGNRVVISEQRSLKSWIDYPWKLVRGDETKGLQLFNLENDPLEEVNLAQSHSELAQRFGALLDARLAENREKEVFELEPGVVDPEHLERLRALGYIE